MRIDRRGSVTLEGLTVLPIAVTMVFLGKFILEASLNRQETAVYARGAAVTSASAGRTSACDFDQDAFLGRTGILQEVTEIDCQGQDAERALNREKPIWDEVEEGAVAWDEILRDVRPSDPVEDIVSTAEVKLTIQGTDFLSQQNPTLGRQSYVSADRLAWTHSDGDFAEAHDLVIWEELCKGPAIWMFPNVFPAGRGTEC
ncbi:MAG: hypothetical protein AAF871_02535 [Pseudomonadota bacterium]